MSITFGRRDVPSRLVSGPNQEELIQAGVSFLPESEGVEEALAVCLAKYQDKQRGRATVTTAVTVL